MNAIDHHTLTRITTATESATSIEVNIFAGIHKAIRRGLGDLLGQMGATDFDDPSGIAGLGDALESLLAFCEDHLGHEENVVRPACGDRLVPEVFDRGHPRHLRYIAEIRALFRAVKGSSKKHRPAIAHALYLHFSVFVADCLEHMAEEERVLLPLMLKTLGEEQVLAIRDRILGSMAPTALAESARRMLSACNATEQHELVLGILAKAPRPVAIELVRSSKPELDDSAFARLMSLVESAPAAI
jgi:hypothetical protein